MNSQLTRMHSSSMRSVRCNGRQGGGCLPGEGRGVCPGGVSAGGVCRGVVCLGGVSLGVSAQWVSVWGVSAWGVSAPVHTGIQPPVDRILDTCL